MLKNRGHERRPALLPCGDSEHRRVGNSEGATMPQALSRARATRMHERGPDGQWWGLAGGRAGGCRTAQGSVGFYDMVGEGVADVERCRAVDALRPCTLLVNSLSVRAV